ncbi:MAG: tetratricopeptide repeat protein [Candidatus Aminicenantales bacterium]
MRPARYILPLLISVVLIGCATATAQKTKSPKKDDTNAQSQYERGVVALKYGLTDEALRYGNLAVSLDPKHYGGHSLIGHAFYQKGNYAEAVSAFAAAAELRPDLPEAHYNLGLACFETGDMDRAEAEFKRANAIKEDAMSSFYLARIYLGQKKLDQALEAAQKSISANPRSAGSYNIKGVILNQLGRFAEAAGSFQAGLVLVPKDVNLQVNLGIAFMNSGQPERARPVLEKVLPEIQDPALKAKIEDYLKSIKPPEARP